MEYKVSAVLTSKHTEDNLQSLHLKMKHIRRETVLLIGDQSVSDIVSVGKNKLEFTFTKQVSIGLDFFESVVRHVMSHVIESSLKLGSIGDCSIDRTLSKEGVS